MKFNEDVLKAAAKAAADHPDDIPKAVAQAEKAIRRFPDFDEMIDSLVSQAITDLIYDARHTISKRMRNAAGDYAPDAKVVVGKSAAVQAAARSVYDYCIGGTTLGMLTGEQLRAVADSEEAIANGHLVNVRLARKLASIVPLKKTVREVVKEARLQKIFHEACEAA